MKEEPPDTTLQDYCVIPPIAAYPSEKDWEIPMGSLTILKVIGKGAFGQVAKGILQSEPGNDKDNRLVAIKMLRGMLTCDEWLCDHFDHSSFLFFLSKRHLAKRMNDIYHKTLKNNYDNLQFVLGF